MEAMVIENEVEVWKPIAGASSYEASNKGNIRSLSRWVEGKSKYGNPTRRWVKGRVLKKILRTDGYNGKNPWAQVSIRFDDRDRCMHKSVARVVYETFHGSVEGGKDVYHRNDIHADDRIDNLIQLPLEHNRAFRIVSFGEDSHLHKITRVQVRGLRIAYRQFLELWAKQLSISRQEVGEIVRVRAWVKDPPAVGRAADQSGEERIQELNNVSSTRTQSVSAEGIAKDGTRG